MNTNTDPVLARIEQAERMLQQARDQHRKGYSEEVTEFMASAVRHIGKAQKALKLKPISFSEQLQARAKEAIHAR